MSQISFKIILVIPIFILLCLSLFVIFAYDIEMANGKLSIKSNISKQIKSNLIGQKKPNFYLTPLNHYETPQEKHLDVPNYKLVNFWASWCPPCRVEHPQLEKLSKNKNIQLFGVNYKDSENSALNFLKYGLKSLSNALTIFGLSEIFSISWIISSSVIFSKSTFGSSF